MAEPRRLEPVSRSRTGGLAAASIGTQIAVGGNHKGLKCVLERKQRSRTTCLGTLLPIILPLVMNLFLIGESHPLGIKVRVPSPMIDLSLVSESGIPNLAGENAPALARQVCLWNFPGDYFRLWSRRRGRCRERESSFRWPNPLRFSNHPENKLSGKWSFHFTIDWG